MRPVSSNVAYETKLFLDGRENSLETQIWSPILSPDEMAAPSVGWELARVRALPDYSTLFGQVFPGRGITMELLRSDRRLRTDLAARQFPLRPLALWRRSERFVAAGTARV